jgi:glycosyltransferase involved in cell wall biosynthesis
MKKVLIITYHWPPAGGGGVQRWLKMSKYLRDYDWEPVIFTVTNNEISSYDESLVSEIPKNVETIRVPAWEPFQLYKLITGKKADENVQPGFLDEGSGNKLIQKLAYWVRGNIFIPDAKRFWIKPARKALAKYLMQNSVDAIASTGPPHSTHLVAMDAKRKFNTPWLADFRDPWTFVDYYHKLRLSSYADRRHHKLEQEVINTADQSVTVTWSWANEFNKMHFQRQVGVITNGYDPADFTTGTSELDDNFTLTHVGSMNADRNPHALWPALKYLCDQNPNIASKLKIKLIGPVDHVVFQSVEKHLLGGKLEHIKNLPHNEVIPHLKKSAVLLLPLNDTPNIAGVVPGKLFEYLGAQRPILCIGKTDGDSARIINEVKGGVIHDFKDESGLKKTLNDYFDQFQTGNLNIQSTGFRGYGRDKLAGEICSVLDRISK